MAARLFTIRTKWHGPDRRINFRRLDDRRREVRYEPDREDRRGCLDRRTSERLRDSYRIARQARRKRQSAFILPE